jgi:23S rRNA pseudouridine2605 synthase
MREGKKRQIREIGKTIGLPVNRIVRVRIGNLKLGNLKPGEWRYLSPSEVKELTEAVQQQKETPLKRGFRKPRIKNPNQTKSSSGKLF